MADALRPGRWVLYAVLAAFAVFFLLPLVVVVLNSFRTAQEIARGSVIGWPMGLQWQNWVQAWSGYCIAQRCEGIQPYMVNSFLLVIPATLLSTVLGAIAGKLGINTVESVLLYHVVPGATIDSAAALKSNGAVLSTALTGQTIKVRVLSARFKLVRLVDGNRKALDPFLVASKLDLNKGNVQIAHGISLVLQPAG